jgi:peptidoglycan/LPS O-acetylase OafA/YrhL
VRPIENDRFEWLQALRAIAAMMVLFFHLNIYWSHVPGLAWLQPVLHWGFAGVDVFFVLSGFVVHHATRELRSGAALRTYALRRAARIYLAYWPALILAVVIAQYVHEVPAPEPGVAWRSVLLIRQDLSKNLLPVAWSLTFELYFYLLLGILMLAPTRRQPHLILAVAAAIIGWNAWWLMTQRELVYSGGMPGRFLLNGYAIEFMAGALVSHVRHSNEADRRPLFTSDNASQWVMGGIGCALMGLAIGTTAPQFDHVAFMRAATFGLVGLGGLLVALALPHTRRRAPTWLVRIGDSSYSLYLLHGPLLGVLALLVPEAAQINPSLALPAALSIPVVIVLISYIWFKVLEAPSMRLARRLH